MSLNRKRYVILSERQNNPQSRLWLAIVNAVLPLVGVVLGAYLTQYFGYEAQLKTIAHQKRQEAFSALMGEKLVTTQLYVSRFEALAFSDYHESRWKLSGSPSDSLDLQEGKRWMQKSVDLVMDLVKNHQTLCGILGSIRLHFKNTPKLVELTDRIYKFKPPARTQPPTNATFQELEAWKIGYNQKLVEFADENYARPIEDLVDYLSADLKNY